MTEWLKAATDLGFVLMEFVTVWVLIPGFIWVLYRIVKTHAWSWDQEKDEPTIGEAVELMRETLAGGGKVSHSTCMKMEAFLARCGEGGEDEPTE